VCLLVQHLGGRAERWIASACLASFIQPIYTLVHYDYLLGHDHVVNLHFVALCVLALMAAITATRRRIDER